jgi:hexosaminidase
MKRLLSFSLLLLTFSATAQVHNSVLPEPQKLIYGKGSFRLRGLGIGFASKPGAEDKFAASELAGLLSKIILSNVPVKESSSGASIIFERTGNSDPLPVPGEKPGPGSRESYNIKITTDNIRITSKSSAGLLYGVQTLRQMIEGSGNNAVIPEAEIQDWPSLVYRGFMMDMSHSQLPKIEEIKNQIDFLSRWKVNQYLFYSEASIELDGFPLLMAEARFTKEQVREIIEYARVRHIDVIPNMELYGHLHDLFRLEHYADLSVVQHGGEFIPDDPRVKPIIEDWVTQISQLFPSPFFHIGFDETWLLEHEAGKRGKSPEELYSAMLTQTTDKVEKLGKCAMVWVDMLQKYPSIIPDVSPKIIAVPWHYSPLSEGSYEKMLGPFTKAGIDMIVQGAILNWNWVVPNFEGSALNTEVLIRAGRKYNAVGFINSGWTDDSQTIMRMAYPVMAYGAVASWQNEPVDNDSFFSKYTLAQYPSELATLVENAHKSLFQAESYIRKSVGATDPAFWANPFSDKSLKMIEANKENLRNGRLAAEDAQVYIRSAMKYGTDTTSLTAMLAGAKMLDFIGMKYLYAGEIAGFWKYLAENPGAYNFQTLIYREAGHKIHSRSSDMLDAIVETKAIFRKAWTNEYTPFRLDIMLGKFDGELQYWLRVQRRIMNLNYREGESLPSLESLFIDGLD